MYNKTPAKKASLKKPILDKEKTDDISGKIQDILNKKTALALDDYTNKNILSKAIKNNSYTFTQNDFDNFIIAAINGPIYNWYTNYADHNETIIMKHMFTNFTPTNIQFDNIISGYEPKKTKNIKKKKSRFNRHRDDNFYWLDILLERGVIFTDAQKAAADNVGYIHMNRFFKNDGIITKEMINYYIDIIEKDDENELIFEEARINKCIDVLPNEYVISLLNDNFSTYVCRFISKIMNKTNLNDSIYKILIDKKIKNYDIINSAISKCVPTNEFINYLLEIESSPLRRHLDLLFQIKKQNVTIDAALLNKLLQNGKYCWYNVKLNFDFNIIGVDIDKLMSFNLNIIKPDPIVKKIAKKKAANLNYKVKYNSKKNVYCSDDSEKDSDDDSEKDSDDLEKDNDNKPYSDSESDSEYIDDSYSDEDKHKLKYGKQKFNANLIKIRTGDLFDLFNVPASIEILKIACRTGNNKLFDTLIKNKLIPNKECLDESVIGGNCELIFKIICYKINPDKDTFNKLFTSDFLTKFSYEKDEKMQEITELLIKNGLVITYSDLTNLIKYDSYLDNLERFSIPYDEKLYFICFQYDNFPKSYKDKWIMNKNIIELRSMCSVKNCTKVKVEQIRKYIKSKKVKPDRYCIDGAYIAGSTQLYAYLHHKLQCEPTIFTFVRTSNCTDLDIAQKIIEKVGIDHIEMSKPFDHVDPANLPEKSN